ncbi:hypothetical protein Salat_1708100 [Sesamum alatum]|uniref:Uncharacterized protein n=1 Tax=Sesamum alatum TaxID=300844 RepID=A0AAE1Y857_9LAMI|nr:hypothetical protein Salat_1708100 [Sesamum alatum]
MENTETYQNSDSRRQLLRHFLSVLPSDSRPPPPSDAPARREISPHRALCVFLHTSPFSVACRPPAKLTPPSRCPLPGDPSPQDRVQAAPPTTPHAPPLCACRTTTLVVGFDVGDRVSVQLHLLSATPHRLPTPSSPSDHHQPFLRRCVGDGYLLDGQPSSARQTSSGGKSATAS